MTWNKNMELIPRKNVSITVTVTLFTLPSCPLLDPWDGLLFHGMGWHLAITEDQGIVFLQGPFWFIQGETNKPSALGVSEIVSTNTTM